MTRGAAARHVAAAARMMVTPVRVPDAVSRSRPKAAGAERATELPGEGEGVYFADFLSAQPSPLVTGISAQLPHDVGDEFARRLGI